MFHGGVSWSPTSDWISYTEWTSGTSSGIVENQVFRLNATTHQKVQLTKGHGLQIGESTSWNIRDEIAFTMANNICVVSSSGGQIRIIGNLAGKGLLESPETLAWSPDGTQIIFSAHADADATPDSASLWILDVQSGRVNRLTNGEEDKWATWASNDTVIFSRAKSAEKPWVLSRINIHTLKVETLKDDMVYVSPSYSQRSGEIYSACSHKIDVDGRDFNFFRGFHIFRTRTPWFSVF
jgi:Tol biopolymer transport system component